MKPEIWRPVVGLEDLYEVSSHGRVRRLLVTARWAANGPRLLTPFKVQGYPTVNLCDLDGRRRRFAVHILVAQAFLGPRPEGYDVSHEDGSRDNNYIGNLKYRTRQGNMLMMHVHGNAPTGENSVLAKLTDAQVVEIRRRFIPRDPDHGYAALGREFGVSWATVRLAYERKSWRHLT